jgi:hypothetical protein
MVAPSARKKKAKKAKRKPVNLQANFNRKCVVAGSSAADAAALQTPLSADMFPSNAPPVSVGSDDGGAAAGSAGGGASLGDFHLHRYVVLSYGLME